MRVRAIGVLPARLLCSANDARSISTPRRHTHNRTHNPNTQALARLPIIERMVAEMAQIYLMKPIDCGSIDLLPKQDEAQIVY